MLYTFKRQLTIYLQINIAIHAKQNTNPLLYIIQNHSRDLDVMQESCGKLPALHLKVSVDIQQDIVLSVTARHT